MVNLAGRPIHHSLTHRLRRATWPSPHPTGALTSAGIFSSLQRRAREFSLISRDPVLMLGLLFCGIFLFIFIVFPLFKGTANGFLDAEVDAPWFSRISLKYLARYFDAYYGPVNRQVFW